MAQPQNVVIVRDPCGSGEDIATLAPKGMSTKDAIEHIDTAIRAVKAAKPGTYEESDLATELAPTGITIPKPVYANERF